MKFADMKHGCKSWLIGPELVVSGVFVGLLAIFYWWLVDASCWWLVVVAGSGEYEFLKF